MAAKQTPKNREARLRKASRERREEERQEVYDAILSAAGELFLERGYNGFSLREVAERIGYSPGTIYLYFKNRDDILFTIADQGYQQFGAMLQDAVMSESEPVAQLIAMGRAYVAFGLTYQAHYSLMFIERTDFLGRKSKVDGFTWTDTFEMLHQHIKTVQDTGYLAGQDTAQVSDILWATLHGVVSLSITMQSFDEARIQRTADMAFQMLGDCLFGA